ncbi:PKD domain-containing protein [Marinilabilia rubra]|uniref:Pkd domain containing protein n=1 Tax=Marinilabilia rubra TaxID=2162893 RepID=A0A2U2BE01_9BACT|nr:PKD domain-containing protein [Marinilabilia rubra]PWE01257.1 pkd domain containing protein [Marinilabilia rubra]
MNKHIFTGLIVAATFWLFLAKTGYAQECDISGKGNFMSQDKLCAPVTATWEVRYQGVKDGGTGNVKIIIDWGDTSPLESLSANNYAADDWMVIANHIYPEDGDQCNYQTRAWLEVNGTRCTSQVQEQLVTVWAVDDENGGELSISPDVFPICIGNDGSVQFIDVSQWNCTPPIEEDTPNDQNRWTQWIYGTGATSITDATVNGTNHAWPYSGSIDYYPAPAEGPLPPPSESENIYIPDYYNVGDFFEVTIRNWNTCNPYNEDPSTPPSDPINGDNPPVTTTAIALIVDIPDGSIDPAGPFCETDPAFTLTPATSGGTWSGPGIDPSTGLFTPIDAGPGTHTITYDVSNSYGCSASGSIDIEVREAPDIDVSPGTSIYLCPGLDLQLDASIANGTPPYTIQWTGDTAPLSATDIEDPQFNTSTIGSYSLTAIVTDATGCSNQADISIDIEDVSIDFTPNPIEVCAGTSTQLSPIVSGGSTTFISHSWTGTDTDKLSATDVPNPEFYSTETGTFTFTYEVIDDKGCSDQTDISVIVKEQPVATAGPDDLACSLTYQLDGNEDGQSSGQWQVISGSGTVAFDDSSLPGATITADTYGTYELSWTLGLNGCTSSDNVTITLSETPSPMSGDDFGICGLTTELEALPDFSAGQWSVTSGPGNSSFSDSSNPLSNVTVDAPGMYTFTWTETTTNGCTGTAQQVVEFYPQAEAQVDPFNNEGCSPMDISFNNTSINADTYQWSFGDGSASSSESPNHIFEASGIIPDTFTVILDARNSYGCNDKEQYEVIANPIPSAIFNASELAGCSPLEISFTNNSTEATTYSWSFGDGSTESIEENPTHTFLNSENFVQSFLTELTAENGYGCTDQHSAYISVYPVRNIELTATPEEGCAPLATELNTQSGAKDYTWNFGDGQTEAGTYQASHIYENSTNQDVSYEVKVTGTSSFGCIEEASATILVHPTPKTSFEATPMEQQMPERTVSVTNNTPGSWNYDWNFGDGTTSTEMAPAPHLYEASGDYEIVLRAYSSFCESTDSKITSILPMVPAIDYGQDESGCPPLMVSFYNNTLDATSYLWEFGDGQVSQEAEPTHTYRVPGTYTVTLTAYGPGGTLSADDVTIEVFETPVALFEPVPKVVYIPNDGVTFLNRSQGATMWHWLFGDGNSSSEFSPTHTYQDVGSYDVTLNVENEKGCTDERTIPDAVKAEQGGEIDFPNAFTPNKSGPSGGNYDYGERNNHVFYPFVQKGIVEYKLQIYSRWGELVFESNDIHQGWDGYFRKDLCPQGVYIWRVTATYSDGRRIEEAGDVTLLR